MEKFKKAFAFIFFMLAGIVLGAFIAYICAGKAYVDWLSWGRDIGIENVAVDLYVIKFSLGLMIHATISQIFTITLALIMFAKVGKSI
ncbi:DUF4321 domain-containing protein [Ruminococcus sp.]|uniref:DUF4321 domain-containing protein n=1 Tax=Ruminococcus sp. TaxID=41978 RepID=UPI0025ECD8C1|nr:DUF4321 domain-containing protein [Ruminococcus sp.]MBQ8966827.1 DUF4321 domain-containing protein [Ruminococcus sp.]